MDKEKIQSILEGIVREIPGCVILGLVNFKNGKPIAFVNRNPNLDPMVAASAGTRSISSAMKVIKVLNPKSHAEESLLTTEQIHFMIRMYPEKAVWIGIGLTLDANLGMARIAIKKHQEEFLQNL